MEAATSQPALSCQQLAALPSLPALAVQYVDFAHWQREWLAVVSEGHLEYWRGQLGEHGGPASLELPTDRPRPKLQTFNGTSMEVEVGANIVPKLEGISQRAGATMFMVLLAAFQLLLSRYSRQEEVCVGSPYAGRDETATQGIVGYFDNTLALLVELSADPTFVGLLRRVRSVVLSAFEHADLPFARVVSGLGVARDASRNPVFQAMLSMLASSSAAETDGVIEANGNADEEATSKFDLTLFVEPTETASIAGLWSSLEYNTDLFDAATARRLGQHFQRLLRSIADEPGAPVSALELMDEEEQVTVLQRWAGEPGQLPSELCLHQLFEEQAQRQPTAEAATFLGSTMDYATLSVRTSELAAMLQLDHSVGTNTPVAVCLERRHEMLVAIMGVLKAGGGYVPMDPKYPSDRIASILETCGARVIVTTADFLGVANLQGRSDGVRLLPVPAAASAMQATEHTVRCRSSPPDLAYILFTSGSTGRPKGVELSHAAALTCVYEMLRHHHIGVASLRYVQTTTYTFDVSVPEIFVPLCCGGTVVLAKPDALLDLAYCEELIREERVTMWGLVPSVLAAFVADCAVPSCLRHVLPIGEALLPETCRRFFDKREGGTRLWNWYGPTEAAVGATILEVTAASAATARVGAMPIGTFYVFHNGYVVDVALRPVGIGVPGELLLLQAVER